MNYHQIMAAIGGASVPTNQVISLAFDSGAGSTSFPDVGTGASTWAVDTGTPTCSTTVVLAGTSSLLLPTNGSSIGTPYTSANQIPATGDFIVSAIVDNTSSWASATWFSIEDAASTGAGTVLRLATNSGGLPLLAYSDGVTRVLSPAGSAGLLTGIHTLVLKRVGSLFTLTEDGVTKLSFSYAGVLNGVPSGTPRWRIGAPLAGSFGMPSTYVDNFTVTR